MTRVQATFVQGTMTINHVETPVYAVELSDGTYVHEQPQSEISLSKYQRLIQKNFPHYDFTTVPEIEVDDAYDPNKVDATTGEVLETTKEQVSVASKATTPAPPPVEKQPTKRKTNTNSKLNNMKAKENVKQPKKRKQEPTTEPIQAEVVKSTTTRRMRRGLAKGTELGIQTVTTTAITALCLASDILATMADGVAWTEAAMIKPLGLHPEQTRKELKEKAIQRTDNLLMKVYAVPMIATAGAKTLLHNVNSNKSNVKTQTVNA